MAGAMSQWPAGATNSGVSGLIPASSGGAALPKILSLSELASLRVQYPMDRLNSVLRIGQQSDPREFYQLCLSLARGIDYAVANNEVPAKAQDLPLLVKQVCRHKNEFFFHVAIMVLMISVKNACKSGWFLGKDSDELLTLANELGSTFCSSGGINTEPSGALPIVSEIMSRYYPRMTMGRILVSLEVKPGYGIFAADFFIPKNMLSTAQEEIRLFVAQTDNIETSSCIISPPQVNFLLNGKGVAKRTTVSMDSGPQFPSQVTSMVKYGTNLLQAVGNFNGHYNIILAIMSVISSSNNPVLQNYVEPVAAALDSDSEIIEGPSRISLNCPISYRRINTPVKGHLCRHLQCFDYDNFMEINSRWPSWRCPHCNQSVCYIDIRIDQNMVKVLREVGDDVVDVVISADGSWKAVLESDDGIIGCQKDGSELCVPTRFSNANAVDLTVGDDGSDVMDVCEIEDRKPFQDNLQDYSIAGNPTVHSEVDTSDAIQNDASQVEDSFWSGLLLSISSASSGSAAPNTGLDAHMVGGISESPPVLVGDNLMLAPVLTDAISPALNREAVDAHGAIPPTVSLPNGQYSVSNYLQLQLSQPTPPLPQGQFSASNNLHLQPSQLGNSIISSETGRPSIPRHVSRTPIAIQALPAQTQISNSHQRPQTSLNPLMPNGAPPVSLIPSMAPHADGFNAVSGETHRQQQFSRSPMISLPVSDMASSAMQHHSVVQNWDHQDRSYSPNQSFQQVVGFPATSQVPGNYRTSSGLSSEFQNPRHQLPNLRVPQTTNQPSMVRPSLSTHLPRMQIPQGGAQSVGQVAGSLMNNHARFLAAAQKTAQMARPPPAVPVQLQAPRTGSSYPMNADALRVTMGDKRVGSMGGMMQQVSRVDGLVELPPEQNWRPTGRMRGSLVGQAYSAALSEYMMIQPTQLAQAARPPADPTSHPTVPYVLNAQSPPPQTYSRT